MDNLVSIYHDQVRRQPDAVAFTFVFDVMAEDGATSLTHLQLDRAASRIAAWLRQRCEPGSRVLLVHGPGPEFPAWTARMEGGDRLLDRCRRAWTTFAAD